MRAAEQVAIVGNPKLISVLHRFLLVVSLGVEDLARETANVLLEPVVIWFYKNPL